MATATGRNRCNECDKDRATSKCDGCAQHFCLNHLIAHRQEMSKQLDDIEVIRDIFRDTVNQQVNQAQKHSLFQRIYQWEEDSIKKIKQTAEDARQAVY